MQSYSAYFQDKASDILREGENKRIKITPLLSDIYDDTYNRIMRLDDQDTCGFIKSNEYSVLIEGKKYQLTQREFQCCQYIRKGYTAKLIAAQLRLSSRTVEYYLQQIKIKLQCRSRFELFTLLNNS